MKKIFFISGVSGVGKTTLIPHLKSLVPTNFEMHDFDEGGVPAGADHKWRIERTISWIKLGDQKSKEGITVVVCGISNPDEIENIKEDFPDLNIITILLDGDVEVIEQRLRDRNKNVDIKADLERVVGSAETFIQNNSRFLLALRDICKKHNCPIINTTNLKPEEVAKEIRTLIRANG